MQIDGEPDGAYHHAQLQLEIKDMPRNSFGRKTSGAAEVFNKRAWVLLSGLCMKLITVRLIVNLRTEKWISYS
jgi:hypothetical protein